MQDFQRLISVLGGIFAEEVGWVVAGRDRKTRELEALIFRFGMTVFLLVQRIETEMVKKANFRKSVRTQYRPTA